MDEAGVGMIEYGIKVKLGILPRSPGSIKGFPCKDCQGYSTGGRDGNKL